MALSEQTLDGILRRRPPRLTHAHPLVAKVAIELAAAVFEEAMTRNNDMFRALKKQNPGASNDELQRRFCRWLAPELVGDARAMLAQSIPGMSNEDLKAEIYEALIADGTLRMGRMGNRRLLTPH